MVFIVFRSVTQISTPVALSSVAVLRDGMTLVGGGTDGELLKGVVFICTLLAHTLIAVYVRCTDTLVFNFRVMCLLFRCAVHVSGLCCKLLIYMSITW